jgi:hypothetical protein
MSHDALEWVAALGPRLRGATKSVLWAGANRAGDGGEPGRKLLPGEQQLVTMGTRRWADEADVQRDHLRAILDKLVDHKVLQVALPAAGPRPAWYRFTLRDPDGLPERFSFQPAPAPFNAASHARATAAKEALQRHLVARSDRATSQAAPTVSRDSGISRWADRRCPGSRTLEFLVGGHRISRGGQLNGTTPLPASASASRWLSPLVRTMWAWCSSRSTVAVASVLGMIESNPLGWMLEVTATERRS